MTLILPVDLTAAIVSLTLPGSRRSSSDLPPSPQAEFTHGAWRFLHFYGYLSLGFQRPE